MNALLIEQRGEVEQVTLNRPDTLNALDDDLTLRLLSYFEALSSRPDVRIVVLRGAGRGFCSGLDLSSDQANGFIDGTLPEKFAIQHRLGKIILAMRKCPQPIIAAVHGVASGGGFCLAIASDIRLATQKARMNAAFIRIGLGGGDIGASYLLPRLIGAGPANALLLTGRMLGAERAFQLGLLADIAGAEELDALVDSYIDDMLSTAPLALRMTKEILNVNIDAPGLEAALALEDRNQVILSHTQNFASAVDAFKAKQPVRFTPEGDNPRRPDGP
jgi:enoyl-CoA hydratase/carnithine racemase